MEITLPPFTTHPTQAHLLIMSRYWKNQLSGRFRFLSHVCWAFEMLSEVEGTFNRRTSNIFRRASLRCSWGSICGGVSYPTFLFTHFPISQASTISIFPMSQIWMLRVPLAHLYDYVFWVEVMRIPSLVPSTLAMFKPAKLFANY